MFNEDTSVNNVYGSTGASAIVISVIGGGVGHPVEDAIGRVRLLVGDVVETPWSPRTGSEGISLHLAILLNIRHLVCVNNLRRMGGSCV